MNLEIAILNFPKEIKLAVLEDALKENNFSLFRGLSEILLNAPLNEGGIETEVIEQIYQKYNKGVRCTCNNGLKGD